MPSQPVAKKIAKATGAENYNILQNNGRLAHQLVDHVGSPNSNRETLYILITMVPRCISTWYAYVIYECGIFQI